jgi:polar amino acid transport system substrate-binding protein
VVEETAHEAFLQTFFPKAQRRNFADLASAQGALRRGEVDYVFADALGLALWIGGVDAAGCCAFAGGPYLESRFFGEGIGFVVRRDDEILRRALDFALHRLWDEGKYAELYLRFFPISPF